MPCLAQVKNSFLPLQPPFENHHLHDVRFFATLLVCLLCTAADTSACFILFVRDGKNILVANHEDWFTSDGAIRTIPPAAGKYGSVIFTFLSEGWAQGGMNEKGLFIDAAHTPYQEISFDDHQKKPNGYIWQMVLDKAATVREAIALLKQYQLPELSEATIMLADASGDAVLIGVHDHNLDIRSVDGETLMQTNFNQWHPELSNEPTCWRFGAASQHLHDSSEATIDNMRSILSKTHQGTMTVYSNIYDLKNKTIYTYNRRDFANPIVVSLPQIFLNGDCLLSLDSIAKNPKHWDECAIRKKKSMTIRGKVLDENGMPLSYVNIGVPGKNAGTLSDPDGSFTITVPAALENDSLHFSSVGFATRKIAVRNASENLAVQLTISDVMLREVIVSGKKIATRTARLGWMGGKDGILPLDTIQGGGAVALMVESPRMPIYIEKLQVRLMYNSKETLTLRLHFFEYDSLLDRPGAELLTKEIMLRENKRFGWARFDLSEYNITLNRNKFFVAFEWIDDQQTRSRMLTGLRAWESWKKEQYLAGNKKVECITDTSSQACGYKYHGNMMDWPGFKDLPPFTGLMIETGKTAKTTALRTFQRKTSFGEWTEIPSTLNAVITVRY
jgi:hypothetical protein